MPCGGIYPLVVGDAFYEMFDIDNESHKCFWCNKKIENIKELMFCDEWDCYLHRDCVTPFLKGDEGKVVLEHGHSVILYFEVVDNYE